MEIKNKKGEVILKTKGKDLEGADLTGADLTRAYLRRADLRRADLRRADLEYANLRDADLTDANLRGTYLEGADLEGADLRGAKNYYSFTAYDTSKRIVHCVKHDNQWMVKAGCFWGTLKELEEKVKESHNSPVYLANIEILKNL